MERIILTGKQNFVAPHFGPLSRGCSPCHTTPIAVSFFRRLLFPLLVLRLLLAVALAYLLRKHQLCPLRFQ